jgi:hypothetical protein
MAARLERAARRALAALLALCLALPPLPDGARLQAPVSAAAAVQFASYTVRLAAPRSLVLRDASIEELEARAQRDQADAVAAELAELASRGLAGSYRFDEETRSFTADLGDVARLQLAADPDIEALTLRSGVTAQSTDTPPADAPLPAATRAAQAVSSISFIQVYSPFVWGRVSVNGLAVQLTLEDSAGNVKGVPYQSKLQPVKSVQIDPIQLYYETVFYDPAVSQPVTIMPGDRVHVVTSGTDPVTGQSAVDDKRIVVDDVRAWTSYEQDKVSGTAPANAKIVVTASGLGLGSYLTPGASVTYADATASADGSFVAPTFRTTTDATYKKIGLSQGSSGFVRVVHPDRNEVYTVQGQNVLALENSPVLHGYAFALPSAPSGLQSGVSLRPSTATTTRVAVTLKGPQGQVKETATPAYGSPYTVAFSSATLSPGDVVEVSINGGPPNQIALAPLAARADLAGNQVVGTGPASTSIVLAAGNVDGYVTKSSTFGYLEKRVTSDGSGGFASGPIQCGSANQLSLRPGSFGYAGYEDARGNFIYMAFAAPTNHVMSDFPFAEGWVADGSVRPSITQRDPSGAIKHQGTAAPRVFWLTNKKLFSNVYYNTADTAYAAASPLQFFAPGDVVTVGSGGQTFTIPVDKVSAYINVDTDRVAGEAPAGARVRVVPYDERTTRREVVADGSGSFVADNSYTSTSTSTCGESVKLRDLTTGNTGRAYVRHDDGSEVFAAFGRSISVHEHEFYTELYLSPNRTIDWVSVTSTSGGPIGATLTRPDGSTVAGVVTPTGTQCPSDNFPSPQINPLTCVAFKDASGAGVLIRPGDSIAVSFTEGLGTATRRADLAMGSLPLITGTPDVDTNTIAGVGPREWGGRATLTAPSSASQIGPNRPFTAFGPQQFTSSSNTLVAMVQGYSGLVLFSDMRGHRLYTAWAVTAFPVKIVPQPRIGASTVCGVAAAGTTVRIHDVTIETQDVVLGTGTTDSAGKFCVSLSAPLRGSQVVIADADGTYSQPVVVFPFTTLVPVVGRASSLG